MKCNVCGQQIPDDSVFCPDCGAKVVNLKLIEEEKRMKEELERIKQEEERWRREEAAEERKRRKEQEEEERIKRQKEENLRRWREEKDREIRREAIAKKKEQERIINGIIFWVIWSAVWIFLSKVLVADLGFNPNQLQFTGLLAIGFFLGIWVQKNL